MSSIDKRVVQMLFDNDKFEAGIAETMLSLKELDNSLKLKNGMQAFSDINAAAEKVELNPIARAIEFIEDKFMDFGVTGTVALVKLGNTITDIFGNAIKTIATAGRKRALNIQQAEFQFKALGLNVKETMQAANNAVSGTAYGLDEAALAAANFAATGIKDGAKLEKILLGVAGVAAMGGREFSDVSNVFSKVAGQGRLMGDDLNRLASYGINAAAIMSEQLGMTEADFRQFVSEGGVSFEMFADAMTNKFGESAKEANQLYTGALANMKAALGRIGAEFWSPFLISQRDLFNALSPFIDQIKHIATPAILAITKIIDFFIQGSIRGINAMTKAMKPLAERFKILTSYIKGDLAKSDAPIWIQNLANAFAHLNNAIKVPMGIIKEVFNEIFPQFRQSIDIDRKLKNISESFLEFSKSIMPSQEQLEKLREIVTNVFTKLKTFIDFVKNTAISALNGLKTVIEYLWPIFAKLGEIVVALVKTGFDLLRKSLSWLKDRFDAVVTAVKNFWNEMNGAYEITTKIQNGFENIRTAILNFLDGVLEVILGINAFGDSSDFAAAAMQASSDAATWMKDKIDKLTERLKPATDAVSVFFDALKDVDLAEKFNTVLDKIKEKINDLKTMLAPLTEFLKNMFGSIGEYFANFTGGDLMAIGTGAGLAAFTYQIIGVITSIKNMITGSGDIIRSFKEMLDSIAGAITNFTESIKGNIDAQSMKTIAIAIAILVGAIIMMSFIDTGKAMLGLGAVIALMVALRNTLESISATSSGLREIKILEIAASLAVMGIGVIFLAKALNMLSGLDPASLAAGTIALGVSIILMSAALKFLSVSTKSMNPANLMLGAKAMGAMGMALMGVALAFKIMDSTDPERLGDSLFVFAIILLAFAGILERIKGTATHGAAAIMAIGISLIAIAVALKIVSSINPERLGQALLVFAVSMLALVGVLDLISGRSLTGAAAILAIGMAVALLAVAVTAFGLLPIWVLVKGLVAITVALLGLAVVVVAMGAATAGAVAMLAIGVAMVLLAGSLLILAAGLMAFMGVIAAFSAMDINTFKTGLTYIVTALAALFLVSLPLAIISPLLLLLGLAFIALGVGVAILAAAMTTLIVAIPGTLTLLVLLPILTAFAALSPLLLVLGAALIVLGVGLLLVSAALVIFGVGLGLIAVSLPLAIIALQMLAARAEELANSANHIIIFSIALGIFGAAAVVAGLGSEVLAIGMTLLAVGLLVMGAAMMLVGSQLGPFSDAMAQLIPQAIGIIELGLAFAVAGLLFIVGAIGFGLMGIALLALSAGLTPLQDIDTSVIDFLKQLAEASGTFAWNAPGLIAGAAGLLAFGVAAIAVGIAAVLLSQGISTLAESVDKLTNGSDVIVDALDGIVTGLEDLEPSIHIVDEVVGPISDLAAALNELWQPAIRSAQGLIALSPAIGNVSSSTTNFDVGAVDGISSSLTGLADSANGEPITDVDDALNQLNGTSVPGLDDTTDSMNALTGSADPSSILDMNAALGDTANLDPEMLEQMGISMADLENTDPTAVAAMGDSAGDLANIDPSQMGEFSDILGGMGDLDPSALNIMGDSITDIGETSPEGIESINTSLKEIEGIDPQPVQDINTALQDMQNLDATPIDNVSTALTSLSETITTFDGTGDVFDTLGLSLSDLRAHAIILADANPSLNSMAVAVVTLTGRLSTLASSGDTSIQNISTAVKTMTISIKVSLSTTEAGFKSFSVTVTQSMNDSTRALSGFQNGLNSMANSVRNDTSRVIAAISSMRYTVASSLNGLAIESHRAGVNFGQGFINGMSATMSAAINKAQQMGEQAVAGLNRGAGNKSPSVKGYLAGTNLFQGAINGMEYLRARLVATSENAGASAAKGLELGLNHINDLASGVTIDAQSAIRVSIDDQMGASRLMSLLTNFDDNQIDYTNELRIMSSKLDAVVKTNELLLGINRSINELEINIDGEYAGALVTPYVNRNIRVDQERRDR